MNRLRFPVTLLLLGALPAAAAESATAAAIAARFKQTRARIDVLFRHRDEPAGPLATAQNPFRIQETATAPTGPAELLPPSDDVVLKQAIAALKIGGTFLLGGKTLLGTAQGTYEENSNVSVRLPAGAVILHLTRVTPVGATFTYNTAEQSIVF